MNNLVRMFNPKTIALVGATEREGSIGRAIMENLLALRDVDVRPVNISARSVLGIEACPRIGMIPGRVDLALVATPARTVPSVVEECGMSGVNGVVVVSGGFGEMGEEGKKLEGQIKDIGKRYPMRVFGTGSAGFARPPTGLNATFLKSAIIHPGNIAFLSQSAGLCSAIVDWAANAGIGFSMVASLGSMIDVDVADLIDFLAEDYATKSILIYMESLGSAKRFVSAARAVASKKPIIVLRSGRFDVGDMDAALYTGQGGDDQIYDAVFRRAGVLRVGGITELFNSARILDSERLPRGPRVAIITNAGPPAVVASDALMRSGAVLARLSDESLDEMRALLPPRWNIGNPLNLLAFADIARYVRSMEICLKDPAVDGLFVFYVPQAYVSSQDLAAEVARIAKRTAKPVIATWMGAKEVEAGRRIFIEHNIPVFKTPEDAARTYVLMYRRRRNLDHLYETPAELPVCRPSDRWKLKSAIGQARAKGRTVLDERESKALLFGYGIPVAMPHFAVDSEEAVAVADKVGYPVALKIASAHISKRSDVGGVVLGVGSGEALRQAWSALLRTVRRRAPFAEIEGVFVEPMIEQVDYRLTLAARKDSRFGTVIALGLDGPPFEVFREFSVGLPPLNQTLARMLIQETKAYDLLKGFRGKPPADFEQLEAILVSFSNLIVDFPELAEIIVSPLAIADGKACSLGARMVIDKDYVEQQPPYPHLIIKPYPVQYVTTWRTRDGLDVTLRPIKPEDEPLEQEMFASLSQESIRMRLLAPVKDVTSHEWLVGFCNIDYDRHMAIIAEITEGGKRRMIGVGRLAMAPDFLSAELALLVHDHYQGKGLGQRLLRMLIDIGKERGIEVISGEMLVENTKMLNLAMKVGFTARPTDDGTTEVRLDLKG